MHFLRSTYLTKFFFILIGANVILFAASFAVPVLYLASKVMLLVIFGLTFLDVLLVFSSKDPLAFRRELQERMNLGDPNQIVIHVSNISGQPIRFLLYEGFPTAMQERELTFRGTLLNGSTKVFSYEFKPVERGKYRFGSVFFVIASVFGLVSRRYEIQREQVVDVYPSILQMKRFELMVFQQQKTSTGIKKVRRIGNNSEFEQIKNYVQGDEVRTINWKATSRKVELMVNQYQEEKSQHIYCLIDKSRNMQVGFEGMSVLDYAINSTLVFSNVALRNGDKTGLITFSDKIGTKLPANRSGAQMKRIMEELYDQQTQFLEPNYELLYQTIRRTITTRSLLVLFTNFQTEFAMRRALPMLRRINQKHVLVVVFFENTDLIEQAFQPLKTSNDVYQSAVAERVITLKSRMADELRRNKIQTILTTPSELSIDTINKYLELKARGAI
jgi:uncharacterized protein (DUF58 family)